MNNIKDVIEVAIGTKIEESTLAQIQLACVAINGVTDIYGSEIDLVNRLSSNQPIYVYKNELEFVQRLVIKGFAKYSSDINVAIGTNIGDMAKRLIMARYS